MDTDFKISKLALCGISPLLTDMKILFLLSLDQKNISFAPKRKIEDKEPFNSLNRNFFEIFPKLKSLKISEKEGCNHLDFYSTFKKKIIVKKKEKQYKPLKTINYARKHRFTDYADIENFLFDIHELIVWPTLNYRLYGGENIESSKGILLSGPPGCGKTHLVHVIAGELNLPIFYLSPHKISNPLSGINGKKIQNLFQIASSNSPSIIFIDEIDVIVAKKEGNSRDYEKNVICQLLFLIDEIRKNKKICVIIIGATNFLDQLDDSIRRPGRFDKEIKFKIPSFLTRLKIIQNLLVKSSFNFKFNTHSLALATKGFVSGDLFQLISFAASFSVSRLSRTLIKSNYREKEKTKDFNFFITQKDLDKAKKLIDPGLLKNGFNSVPEICWSDIGALDKIKKVLSKYIIEPIRFPLKRISNHNQGVGLLLYGPPGCGKTLLINAAVRESGANFIFVKGPEILNKFLGESEKGIRKIFLRAKLFDPTIIFFDEFDSVASKRELSQESPGSLSNDRIVNQLLTEIDSIEKGKKIYFIGATNRPGNIDKALLRPGRIDKMLPVPYPNLEEKFLILKTIFRGVICLPFLNLNLFSRTLKDNFTGAELNLSLKEASFDASRTLVNYFFFTSCTEGLYLKSSISIGTKNLHYGINKVFLNRKIKDQFV